MEKGIDKINDCKAIITQKELREFVGFDPKKQMPCDESKPRWSISIKNEGTWEEIGHTDDMRDAVEFNRLKSVVDELKEERNKLNDTIDKKDIDSKQDFEEIQKLKKSNRIKDIGLYTIAVINIIAIIYNLM